LCPFHSSSSLSQGRRDVAVDCGRVMPDLVSSRGAAACGPSPSTWGDPASVWPCEGLRALRMGRSAGDQSTATGAFLVAELEAVAYRPAPAAKALGVSRSRLYELMAEGRRPMTNVRAWRIRPLGGSHRRGPYTSGRVGMRTLPWP
jgi:hypothetical protein